MEFLINDCRRAIAYRTKGQPRGVILFLNGFPNYPQKNHPIVEVFSILGYDVVVPMYSWTHESAGAFDVDSSIGDALFWFRSISSWEIGKYDRITLAWCSYGSFVLGHLLKNETLPGVFKAFFISPLWYSEEFVRDTSIKNAHESLKKHMMDFYPYSYRFSDVWGFFDRISWKKTGVSLIEANPDIESIVIRGKDDATTTLGMAESLASEFSRSSLVILNWGHASRLDIRDFSDVVRKNMG